MQTRFPTNTHLQQHAVKLCEQRGRYLWTRFPQILNRFSIRITLYPSGETMPDSDNPRSYVRPVPLPIPSHQGLKITARNAKIYTCEVPTRQEVARENYERRTHQMSKCGYRSVIYKPYQPVGEVYLDDKKLILSALGQEQTEQEDQVRSIVFYIFHWQCWTTVLSVKCV